MYLGYPENIVSGNYNMWLPMQKLTDGNVIFLRSNPDTTLTAPGTAAQVITAGGYQVSNNSMYADSGRGYTVAGEIKPDFVAPAVNVYGPGLRGNYVTYTGTSAAAAVTAGAVAPDHAVGAGAAERSGDVQRRDQKYAHPRCKALGGQGVPEPGVGVRCAGCLSGV